MNAFLRHLFLSVMTVFAIGTAIAQPSSMPVEPGTKGNLPAVQDIPAATEDILPILHLEMVTGHYVSNAFTQELSLRFPAAQTLGGQYYILQYKSGNSWVDYASYDGVVKFEGDNAGPTHIAKEYRLKLNGGNRVSNVITVPYVNTLKCFLTWLDYNMSFFVGTGIMLRNCKAYVERHTDEGKKEEYDENCEYYKYQWYRRNPNTYEMTLIEGATEFEYTPTMEDVGYEIVKAVMGDNENVAFYGAYTDGIVKMPIEASIEYLDRNGFVLNTSYVLPDGGKGLCLSAEPGDPYCESVPLPEGSVKELKPGQYAVSINVEQYEGYEVRYEDDRYRVAFLYEMPDWGDDGKMKTTYREAQLMPERYEAQLMVKSFFNDDVISGIVDVIGKNWEGKLEVIASMTTEELRADCFHLSAGEQYYVKLRQTDNTLETYYPNALTWEDAKPIEPKMYDGSDEWHVTVASIEAQPAFKPLDGDATIKGKINLSGSSARTKVRKAEGEEGDESVSYTVYLKDKSDNTFIAMTKTDAEGNYQFDNVPIGSYQVIPNVEGYKNNVSEANVTEDGQVVTVDCTVTEATPAEIFNDPDNTEPAPGLKGDVNGDNKVNGTDIQAVINVIVDEDYAEEADVNKDSKVNGTDIQEIINIIVEEE